MTDPRVLTQWEGGAIDAMPPDEPRTSWMLTFADVVSLLLTFFVLLFALSGVQAERWSGVAASLSRALNPPLVAADEGSALKNLARAPSLPGTDVGYLASLLEGVLRDAPALKSAQVSLEGERLVVRLPAEAIFALDAPMIAPAARAAVVALAEALSGIDNRIAVTVAGESAAPGYASAVEFSLARAASLANALRAGGIEKPLRAAARAGATAVEIVISPDKGSAP